MMSTFEILARRAEMPIEAMAKGVTIINPAYAVLDVDKMRSTNRMIVSASMPIDWLTRQYV